MSPQSGRMLMFNGGADRPTSPASSTADRALRAKKASRRQAIAYAGTMRTNGLV
jgi:hypothetical protein